MDHASISGETFQHWSSKPPATPLNLATPDADSPLFWWRTRMADDFSRSDLAPLRGALKGTQINFEPRWSAGVTDFDHDGHVEQMTDRAAGRDRRVSHLYRHPGDHERDRDGRKEQPDFPRHAAQAR
jgi:hypothetical protein